MWEAISSFLFSALIPTTAVVNPLPSLDEDYLDIPVEPLAVVAEETVPLEIRAKSGLVIETHSNEALFSHNAWEVLPIASLTKLMTALVVTEHLPLDQLVTVSPYAASVGGSTMGLKAGDQLRVEDLLKGLLINSGNDASLTLAEATAGTEQSFVDLMNQRTQALGLEVTSFVDPAGIGENNRSSAFEVAHLAKQVFRDPTLRSIMREQTATVSSEAGRVYALENTNRLLGTDIDDRIIAGKTGTTPVAGQCLISFISHEPDRITMAILLGSPDRYSEMKNIIQWVDETYRWTP